MSEQPPLRIAMFAETYLPYLSGMTVSTETLARGLGAAGHQVLLVAPRPAGDGSPGTAGASGPEPAYAWLPSYQAPPPGPPGYRMPLPLPSEPLTRARDFAPQIVHAQSPFVSGLMARRLAQKTGAPLVFTHHTRFGDYGHYLGPLAQAGRRALGAYLGDYWRGCAAVVAPGSELADEIREALAGRSRPLIRMIPTGIDVRGLAELPPAEVREAHGWPPDAIVAVSLGRVAEEKNVHLLLEAFALAAAGEPRLRFLLVGGGPSAAQAVERVAQQDLAGRVALTGALPHRDALAQVRGSDLFVFASQTETQGLVLAEALAAGVPVVALAGPGVGDSVRDGVDGVVVGERTAGALGSAVVQLAGDSQRRGAMADAASRDAGRFAVERRIGQVVDLYRELLGDR